MEETKTIENIIKENFFKFVTPTLLTLAEAIIHPYKLESCKLEYHMECFTLTIYGYSDYGHCTIVKEIK
jgi:hypothetical protein